MADPAVLKLTIDLGQIERAAETWARFPERMQRYLMLAMQDSEIKLLAEIKDRVPVRTGTLRRSWNAELPPKPNATGIGFAGRVGSNLEYARYIDLGFHGTENVRAHSRLGHPVRAFSRTVNFAGKPYTRPAFEAAAPYIRQYHLDAVRQAIQPRDEQGRFTT